MLANDILIKKKKAKVVNGNLVTSLDPFKDGSLVAKYLLDGNANDLLGNNNGVATNVTYITGLFGNAASFNGTTSKITTTTHLLGTNPQTSATISFFVKAGTVSTWQYFITDGNAGSNGTYLAIYTTGTSCIEVGDGSASGGSRILITSTKPISSTSWQHVVYTRTGGTGRLYIDGILAGTATTTWSTNYPNSAAFCHYIYSNQFYQGSLDEIETFNRALSGAEVYSLYTQSNYSTDPTTSISGLVAHYPLTGTAEDKTGAYNGIENGGMLYANDAERGAVATYSNTSLKYISAASLILSTLSSVSFWVMRTSNNADQAIITDNTNRFFATNYSSYWAKNGANTLNFVAADSTSMCPIVNRWYHIVITDDGSTIKGYRDGVNITNTVPYLTMAGFKFNYIGSYTSTGANAIGNLSALRIYNKALNATEINTIYNYEKVTHSIPYDNGLVAYYPLSTNALDNEYNQYDGTATAVTFDGTSGSFSGSSSYIVPSAKPATLWDGDFSVSIWVKLNTMKSLSTTYLFSAYGTRDIQMQFCDNYFYLDIWNGASNATTSSAVYSINTWYHVVVTRSKTAGVKFYINTIANGTSAFTGNASATANTDGIGCRYSDNRATLDGKLSSARFYNKALNVTEAQGIYNAEKSKFGII